MNVARTCPAWAGSGYIFLFTEKKINPLSLDMPAFESHSKNIYFHVYHIYHNVHSQHNACWPFKTADSQIKRIRRGVEKYLRLMSCTLHDQKNLFKWPGCHYCKCLEDRALLSSEHNSQHWVLPLPLLSVLSDSSSGLQVWHNSLRDSGLGGGAKEVLNASEL